MNTYEKKYKEALEMAKDYYKANQKLGESDENEVLSDIFPELKESEDEKVMHQLHSWMKEFGGAEEYTEKVYTWLKSLLEKQGTSYTKRDVDDAYQLEKQGEQDSLNINQEHLKGIKRVQEYQDLSDWEKNFDNIASIYAHNKNQEGYSNSWYIKERAAEMLYHAKKELEKQSEPIEINPTEFDTRLQALIGKFDSLPKEELIGSLSFWMNVVQNDGTYKADKKQSESELKDDEDERIRQELITFVKGSIQDEESEQRKAYLAWLEKQGEPTDNDMIEALRTEYEKGKADAIAETQKEWSEEDENILRTIISDGIRGAEFDMLQIDWLKSLKQRIGG